ncbi:MAG TPA: AEC family transporter [Chthoniobacteraceae bacterium]|nr:AEC family transporter [Chthoniobacteraceae bacterium]
MLIDVFFQVLLPILAMFAVGWAIDRKFNLDLNTIVKLNVNVFVPAFIFTKLVDANLERDVALKVMGYTVCVSAAMFVAGAILGRALGYSREHTRGVQIAAMFYNSANYGIPLMALAYPGRAEVLQVFVILVQNVGNFTVGVFLASSATRSGWRAFLPALRQFSIYAVTAALIVRAFDIPVQQWRWFWIPLNYFASGLVAFALITLGIQLSKTEHRQPLSQLGSALGLRLIGGPLVAASLVPLFGFNGETALVMILSASFPTAVNTALVAHEMGADHHFAAATVFWSTVLSMITVTVLIVVLRLPRVEAMF